MICCSSARSRAIASNTRRGGNPDPIIRTVCAFANDFENLGGGCVVIGQDCDTNGQPVFPPAGLPDTLANAVYHCSYEKRQPIEVRIETDEERTAFVIRRPVHPLARPAAPEVTGEVGRLLRAMAGEMSRQQIQEAQALRHEDHFRNAYRNRLWRLE